jgi:hypothetical protein
LTAAAARARGTYPLPIDARGLDDAEDPRFAPAVKRTAAVLEQEGYPRVSGDDRTDLAAKLMEFLYASRGAAGELEKRLNGTAAPLVSPTGTLDSYDCLAVGHELRRLKGARGALVIAMDADDHLSIGLAAEEGSMMDIVGNELIGALERVITKRGWKAPEVKDVGMEFVVEDDKNGGLKS